MGKATTHDDGVVKAIQATQQWHASAVAQLRLILDHKDASIQLGDRTIAADSDLAEGVRIGIVVALNKLGELPLKLERTRARGGRNG